MKKKNILFPIFALCLTLGACDEVDENDRQIPVEDGEIEFGSIRKVVLMEEFTGQACMNCPQGAAASQSIVEFSEHHMIPVNIHYGMYAIPTFGFVTESGTAYGELAAPDFFPACRMDRNTDVNSNTETWMSMYMGLAFQNPPIDVEVSSDYNNGEARITTTLTALENIDQPLSLQLWLLESGIRAMQLDGSTYIMDYEHNHVFRAAINGTWGQPVEETLGQNEALTIENTYTLAELADLQGKTEKESRTEGEYGEVWVPDSCNVVAFVYNTETRAILQAAETTLKAE